MSQKLQNVLWNFLKFVFLICKDLIIIFFLAGIHSNLFIYFRKSYRVGKTENLVRNDNEQQIPRIIRCNRNSGSSSRETRFSNKSFA